MTRYKNKIKAFTLVEISIAIFIFILLTQLGIIKYFEFIDRQNIKIAKTKLTDYFFTASLLSLKNRDNYTVIVDYQKREILLKKANDLIKKDNLPKNIYFASTEDDDASYIKSSNYTKREMTKNGNIAKSFSIYIFDRKKIAKHRISFYGFSHSKFLKINNYKKIGSNDIKLKEIMIYHNNSYEDREKFKEDWQLE